MTAGGAPARPPASPEWADAHVRAVADQRARLAAALDALAQRAAGPIEALLARPAPDAWSGAEVLEHVVLAHRFLFALVDKIARKCRARVERGAPWPAAPPALEVVARLADPERRWPHPEHMTPTGALPPAAAAARLRADRERLFAWLAEMPAGQGTLHRIRMSRVDARLDLYQWIELVALHAERHARQIDRATA